MSQNSINSGYIASVSTVVAGVDQRELVTPYTLQQKLNLTSTSTTVGSQNLNIIDSAGNLTVTGMTSALSTSNPAYVTIPNGSGVFITKTLTAQQSMNFNFMLNSTFGTTAGVAWNDMPMFVYVAMDALQNVRFFLSRVPHLTQIGSDPSVASLKWAGRTGNMTNDRGVFFLQAVSDANDWINRPCARVGYLRMDKSALDQWSMVAGTGMMSPNYPMSIFSFPRGQGGAIVDEYFTSADAPEFDSGQYRYLIFPDGRITIKVSLYDMVDAGTGSSETAISLPFKSRWHDVSESLCGSFIASAGTGATYRMTTINPNNGKMLKTLMGPIIYNNDDNSQAYSGEYIANGYFSSLSGWISGEATYWLSTSLL